MPMSTMRLSAAAACAALLFACAGTDQTGTADSGAPVVDSSVVDASSADAGAEAGGQPVAVVPSANIDFGTADCGGAAAAQKTFVIQNTGSANLTWSATLDAGTFFFVVGDASGSVPAGQSATVTVGANAIMSNVAAAAVQTSTLTVATNDAAHASTPIKLTQTAGGGSLTLMPQSAQFGLTALNVQAPDIPLTLKNTGNKPLHIGFDTTTTDPQFAIVWTGAPLDATVAPGASVAGLFARFKPTSLMQTLSNAPITTATGDVLCGASNPQAIALSGTGTSGVFGYTPAAIDFGLVGCGTTSTLTSAMETITISNAGNSPFTWTATLMKGAASPYTLTTTGSPLAPSMAGTIVVNPKPIPQSSSVTPDLYDDAITITTNIPGDATPHTVSLTQTAQGAIINYVPATAVAFGGVPINTTSTASFNITNVGNAPATLTAGITNGPVYSTLTAVGAVNPGDMIPETISFTPTAPTPQPAQFSLTKSAGDVLCSPLPPLSVTGTGTNGTVDVQPSSGLDFGQVNCGSHGAVKTVTITNTGNGAFTYAPVFTSTMTTPGTSYSCTVGGVACTPMGGTVQAAGMAGSTVTLTITPQTIPIVPDVTPDLYGDTLTITTSVMGDSSHVVPLHMTAHGAILVQSGGDIGFGGVKTNTTAQQQFSVSNNGNASALVTVTNANPVFGFTPTMGASIAGGNGAVFTASFTPTTTTSYSDTGNVKVAAGTALCGPLPAPFNLTGNGTTGVALVTPSNLDFGLVPCATQAQAQTIVIQNNGGATFTWAASLMVGGANYGLGAPSGSVGPGTSFNLVVTPVAIPSSSFTTADLYAGQVQISTNVVGDSPHVVALHETAQGARLSLDVTSFPFGVVPVNGSAQRGYAITNSGNTTANITYAGYMTPPFTASPDMVPILGTSTLNGTMTFAPLAPGAVSGQTFIIQASDLLCAPLPQPVPVTGTGQ